MNNRTSASNLYLLDAAVSNLIAQSRDISEMDALRLFIKSETHHMLEQEDQKMWYFSPQALFDMWENEIATGDPRNSYYLRGDEIE